MRVRTAVGAIAIAASLTITAACSSDTSSSIETTRAAAAGEEIAEDLKVTSSTAFYGSVVNQLDDWWDGGGIPIKWSVTNTKNVYWDGSSRPDHAPPQGFQGLEQPAFSPPYTARLEVNDNDSPTFTLTPSITVDGKSIELKPTVVKMVGTLLAWWEMDWAQNYCNSKTDSATRRIAIEQFSVWTPRGELKYEYIYPCGAQRFTLTVQNVTGM